MGGSEAEAYAPIVGAGPNSTALHYDRLGPQDSGRRHRGDGCWRRNISGYAADITRTVSGQREKFHRRGSAKFYDIVLRRRRKECPRSQRRVESPART